VDKILILNLLWSGVNLGLLVKLLKKREIKEEVVEVKRKIVVFCPLCQNSYEEKKRRCPNCGEKRKQKEPLKKRFLEMII
jgi:predicted amidophosphoribosyltransferase